jgi:hypothetical protein
MHWPVMSWGNAYSMCMHQPVMSWGNACTFCMGSKVSSLSRVYLYSSYFAIIRCKNWYTIGINSIFSLRTLWFDFIKQLWNIIFSFKKKKIHSNQPCINLAFELSFLDFHHRHLSNIDYSLYYLDVYDFHPIFRSSQFKSIFLVNSTIKWIFCTWLWCHN